MLGLEYKDDSEESDAESAGCSKKEISTFL